jgi:hypothetical protein
MVIRLVDRDTGMRDECAARADDGGHLPIIIKDRRRTWRHRPTIQA